MRTCSRIGKGIKDQSSSTCTNTTVKSGRVIRKLRTWYSYPPAFFLKKIHFHYHALCCTKHSKLQLEPLTDTTVLRKMHSKTFELQLSQECITFVNSRDCSVEGTGCNRMELCGENLQNLQISSSSCPLICKSILFCQSGKPNNSTIKCSG